MSWIKQLCETYEFCLKNEHLIAPQTKENSSETLELLPVSHISQQAHICIAIDQEGNFKHAELLPPKTSYIIPATEDSASRSGSKPPPNPLADKVRYCSKDYLGEQDNFFTEYTKLLKEWCDSEHCHPKALAVFKYTSKGTVTRDLIQNKILLADDNNALLTKAPKEIQDSIFKRLANNHQGDAVIIWKVYSEDTESKTWKDKSLQQAWIAFDNTRMQKKDICILSGQQVTITDKHPNKIRHSGDKTKLISSNDRDGFTYKGRFLQSNEVCTLGYEASNKAHNALRWLISRQGYRNGEQAIVAWASSGVLLPQPCESLCFLDKEETVVDKYNETCLENFSHNDLGENFSIKLAHTIRGYKSKLKNTKGISIIALDATSTTGMGRLSVTFYRSQLPQEYLDRLQAWQENFAWVFSKKNKNGKLVASVFAPTPKEIARIAYGQRIDDKLLKATIERLLPCIIDGAPFPIDIVNSCYHRACMKSTLEKWEQATVIATACSVYKGYYAGHLQTTKRRKYSMSLEEDRVTRDYLYGRLLAVAEYLERKGMGDENRPTNAERLMVRFADRPFSTWRTIEMQLSPYLRRLQSKQQGTFIYGKILLQTICNAFVAEDFSNDDKLSGEFLLAYHCQLSALYTPKSKKETFGEKGACNEQLTI